jgi:polar amino acid transport system substrate-binding protein
MHETGGTKLYVTLEDANGKVLTEKELQSPDERIMRAGRMLTVDLLFSSVGHEIANANNYITLGASMLAEIWEDLKPALNRLPEEYGSGVFGRRSLRELETIVPQMINGIHEGSGKAVSAINRMRAFAATPTPQTSAVNINGIIQQASALMRQYTHKHTGSFHVILREDLPPVWGSESLLIQLFVNLIMNAVQSLAHKRAGVTVETSLDRDQGDVVIAVRDEGRGMSAEILERITELFFTTREEEGGAGLGLFIVAAIVREHKGCVEFQSLQGHGTTATVRLPIFPEGGYSSGD